MSTALTSLHKPQRHVNIVDMNSYHHGDLKKTLLDAAWAIVADEGAAAFSLRQIARTAGVDPAAVYRHFKSKDAILSALSQRAFAELAQTMEDSLSELDGAPAKTRLTTIGAAYIHYATSNPHLFEMMFATAGQQGMEASYGTASSGRGAYDILRDEFEATSGLTEHQAQAALTMLWANVHGLSTLSNQNLLPAEDPKALLNLISERLVGLLLD